MSKNINPFQIKTPEKLNPKEAVSLFVDIFTDYQKIKTEGHTFVTGPRGIGKSMMLRYLQPDCQCILAGGNVETIEFLGFYIPLRNASFTTITELKRLENNASLIINEHIMSLYFVQKVNETLSDDSLYGLLKEEWNEDAKAYCKKVYEEYLPVEDKLDCEDKTIHEIFALLARRMESYYRQAIEYTKRLSFRKEVVTYEGPLFDYMGFVLPIVNLLQSLKCFRGKKVYFLVDDAHCLSSLQTHILNYWVSTRTSGDISLKITTQYNYKNYYTVTGATIDAPHDYSEIDMFKVYTSKTKKTYVRRITEIVEKRLKKAGIDKKPEDFFPPDKEQEAKIAAIANKYKKQFDRGESRGNKRTDDALRYSRPDYIKSLLGTSKSGSTYSYAGFEQLIHLSSGIARSFLESAYKMFAEEQARNNNKEVCFITDSVQNEIVRDDANIFLFNELPKYANKPEKSVFNSEAEYPKEDINKLINLIEGLGGLFREILVSDKSERRVFSIAISDKPSEEVNRILKLGVQLGYFHKSTIGKKDGMSGGRTNLYILNRRLAPIWTLDPTSFAGYLFVQNKLLEDAMDNPNTLLRRLKNKLSLDSNVTSEFVQLSLFQEEDDDAFNVEEGE